ncbi:zinc finger protein 197-like [Lacerta agilis]|uniref:zinc finger protein 197-like n=1 Tax=Lacerta agilis TaxID=80427 RepID=UPI001419E915|nr:zinc finger protein 197-like [Lacerta agilis]
MEKALDSSGKVPQIVQVMYFKGPPRPVSQLPETGLPQQQETQWQEFLNALQPPNAGRANSLPTEQVPWDDARTFLSAFEQVAEACRWPREEWVGRLLPALRGGVEHFFCQLDPRDRTDFLKVKIALLRADAIRRESKRQHFRQCRYQELEGPRRIYSQLKELCRQWLKPDKYTKDQILEMIIQEQLLAMLPPEVQSWVKECGPEDCVEMVALAEDFLMGRRSARSWVRQVPGTSSLEAEVPLSDAAQRQLFTGVSPNVMSAMANEMASMRNSAMSVPPVLTPEGQGMTGVGPAEEPEDVKNVLPHQNPLHLAAMQENGSNASISEGLLFPTPEMNPLPQHQNSIFPQQMDCGETILGRLLGNGLRNEIKMENSDDDLETEFSFEGLPDGAPEDDSNTEVSDPSPEEKQDEQTGKRKRKRKCVRRKGRYYPKEKKHTCPECGYMAYYLSEMVRHIKTHLTKGAYKCLECGMTYKEKSSLEAHQQVHISQGDASSSQSYGAMTSSAPMGKEHTCPTCGLSEATPESLFEHMIAHLEERPFKCPECDKTFRYKSHLALHQEMLHLQQTNVSAYHKTPRVAPGPSMAENAPLLLQPLPTASTSAETYGGSSPSKLLLSKPEGEPLSRYGTKTVKVVLTKFAKLCNGRKHTCPECGFVSESLAGIIQHRRVHTEEMPYKCNRCGKCFKSSSHLNKHCSRNTCQQNSLAPGTFLEESQMSYEGVEDSLPTIKTEEEEFEISPGLPLIHEPALSEHPGESSLSRLAAMASSVKCQKKQHTCSQCGYKARSLTDLVCHMRKHTGEKPYMCPRCGKTFAWQKSLKKHLECLSCSIKKPLPGTSVSSTPLVPQVHVAECDVTLSDEEELINILAKKAPKKVVKVQELPRKPSGGGSLAQGQQESSRCREARAAKRSRYARMDKKYQCPECEHRSYYLSDLLRHQKSHGGEKPYKCPECWRAFSEPSACSKHYKTVHQPDGHSGCRKKPGNRARSLQKEKKHTCPKCGHETYKLSTHLIHMKSHAGEGPFPCDKCGENFSYKSNLSRHKKIHEREISNAKKLSAHQQIAKGNMMTVELKPLKVPVLSHMDNAKLAELRGRWGLCRQERGEQAEGPVASAEGASTAEGASAEGASIAEGDSAEGASTEDAKSESAKDAEAEAAELELAEIKAKVRARLERFAYSKGGETNPCPSEPDTSQTAPVEEKPQPPESSEGEKPLPPESSASEKPLPPESSASDNPLSPESSASEKLLPPESSASDNPLPPESSASEKPLSPESSASEKPLPPESSASEKPLSPESSSSEKPLPPESSASEKFSEGEPSLADQQSTNTGEGLHECEECGERFMLRATLLCHRATHTEARPYLCSQCGQGFIRKDSLEAHEKTHYFECSKRFDE